jgi:integrase
MRSRHHRTKQAPHQHTSKTTTKTMPDFKNWKTSLNALLKQHNKVSASGTKAVGYATTDARREILEIGFKRLEQLGYHLKDVRSFREKHLYVLARDWEQTGKSPSTIQNRISVFRTFAGWIGKTGMVRDSECYVENPDSVARSTIAKKDKTWTGNEVNPTDKIAEVRQLDPYVAMQLALQHAFGLRMKEAALLKPHGADRKTYLNVNWGTKGGRARKVDIETPDQREILEQAKQLAAGKLDSMIPAGMDYKQWRNHYYYVCKQAGITRKDGITSHGLRHEKFNMGIYEAITGEKSPIRGGDPTKIDPELDRFARQEIAEAAGHCRQSISKHYIGEFEKQGK